MMQYAIIGLLIWSSFRNIGVGSDRE